MDKQPKPAREPDWAVVSDFPATPAPPIEPVVFAAAAETWLKRGQHPVRSQTRLRFRLFLLPWLLPLNLWSLLWFHLLQLLIHYPPKVLTAPPWSDKELTHEKAQLRENLCNNRRFTSHSNVHLLILRAFLLSKVVLSTWDAFQMTRHWVSVLFKKKKSAIWSQTTSIQSLTKVTISSYIWQKLSVRLNANEPKNVSSRFLFQDCN